MIDDEDCTVDDLIDIVQGTRTSLPVHRSLGKKGAREAYRTGQGKVIVRAVANIEETEQWQIIRSLSAEIPFQVNKARLLEKIGELVKDKRIEGISAIQ